LNVEPAAIPWAFEALDRELGIWRLL
jgi:hypothetical protein